MKLYVCWGTFPMGPHEHPCHVAHDALRDAGHAPEVVRTYGWKALPDVPFNMTPGRRKAKDLTGDTSVPVLELDDGTAIGGSREIVAWAQAHRG
jgi:Glutathione S-transferase, N-terminal domain